MSWGLRGVLPKVDGIIGIMTLVTEGVFSKLDGLMDIVIMLSVLW